MDGWSPQQGHTINNYILWRLRLVSASVQLELSLLQHTIDIIASGSAATLIILLALRSPRVLGGV